MARPLRVEFPGAIYHVVARGVGRIPIFHDAADYWRLLNLLGKEVDLGTLIVHAFALLPNHPHMLCETPGGGLSRWMKRVLGGYAQMFNVKYERFGHVFQARYKAILVEDGDYFLTCSRYIHRNPSKAGLVAAPDQYLWSSYRNYLHQPAVVDWVETNKTLGFFAGPEQYRAFVEAGKDEDLEDPFEHAKAGLVFGSDSFVHRIRALVGDRRNRAEVPSLKTLMRITDPPSAEDVANAVDELFVDTSGRLRRGVLIYALHRLSWLSGKNIAELLQISPSCVSRIVHKMHQAILESESLRNRYETLCCLLRRPSVPT